MCEANTKVVFIPCMWLHSLLGLSVQAAGQAFLVVLSFYLYKAKRLLDFWLDFELFCFLKHKKSQRKMPLWQLKEKWTKRQKTCQGEGEFFFTWMACASLHHVQATLCLSSFFLSLFCLSQCEGVCGCGGLASGRWRPVGVFMVYFWPQQQKACWCSKSVAPIVSITLLLNRLAPLSLAHWQTLPSSAHAAILTMIL